MIGAPGVPIPGSEFISQMFAKRHNMQGSLINYVKNPNVNDTPEVEFADENLDISVIDMNNFRKLISLSKKRNDDSFRRQNYFKPRETIKNRKQTAGYKKHVRENPNAVYRGVKLYQFDRHIEKIYQMMKQSIYVVRDRVERTTKIRSYFSESPSYKLALLDSAIQHYLRKMDYYSRRILKNKNREYFLWYLILYEKVLQCNIDINYAVERSFKINRMYLEAKEGPNLIDVIGADEDALKNIFPNLTQIKN